MLLLAARCQKKRCSTNPLGFCKLIFSLLTAIVFLTQCTESPDNREKGHQSPARQKPYGSERSDAYQSSSPAEVSSSETRYFSNEDSTAGRNTNHLGIQLIRNDLSGNCSDLPNLTAQEVQSLVVNWGGIDHGRYFEPLCFSDRDCNGCKKFISSFLPYASCRPAYDSSKAASALCFVN